MKYLEKIQQSAAYIQEKLDKIQVATIAMITGTGLGGLTDSIEDPIRIPYSDIPEFPLSSVPSHEGCFIHGHMNNTPVIALNGRFHLYEGFDALQVTHGIRVLGELGIKTLILTNAAGALNPSFETGTPMLIEDQINLTGTTPLRGENIERWGTRFPDMCAVYDPQLRSLIIEKALELGIRLERGVYLQIMGPNMETPAETRMYRRLGADAIGMSTCMEAIAAHHMGMRIIGLSCLTNKNLPDCMEEASLETVIRQANRSTVSITNLVQSLLKEITNVTD